MTTLVLRAAVLHRHHHEHLPINFRNFFVPSPGARLPLLGVSLGGLAVIVMAISRHGWAPGWHFIFLAALAFFAETFPAPIPRISSGTTSFATVFVAVAAAYHGFATATLVAATAMVVSQINKRQPAHKIVFNVCTYALAGAAAGLTCQALPDNLRIGVLGALAAWIVNIALLSWALRTHKEPLWMTARSLYISTLWPALIIASLAAVVVKLWALDPLWTLVAVPLLGLITLYQNRLAHAEERRSELDRLRDDFISTTSHELRTPLTSIYGFAQTLAGHKRDLSEEQRDYFIDLIRQESERLVRLTDDILFTSSLTRLLARGHEPIKVMSFDPGPVIEEVLRTAQARGGFDSTHVFSAPNLAGGQVVADPHLLHRVLFNLVENAAKYSPDGGSIRVGLVVEGEEMVLSVQDEGIGIPPERRQHVFDRFIRLDPNMTQGVGGSGLGLYICQQLIEGMGGKIWVDESTRGTLIRFTLPRALNPVANINRKEKGEDDAEARRTAATS